MRERERVIKALEFEGPDRVPRSLWYSPTVEYERGEELNKITERFPLDIIDYRAVQDYLKYEPGTSDIQNESDLPKFSLETGYGQGVQPGNRYIDEWGSIWRSAEEARLGEVERPVLQDISKVGDLAVPWELLERTTMEPVNQNCARSTQFILSELCAHPFERMQFIRGTSALFRDLIINREEVIQLRDKVHEYNLKKIEMWLDTKVDGIYIGDDWGGKDNLLINPDTWRELFKPLYREYCDLIHRKGKYVFFHTDGNVQKIFGDLVEVGVDAINSQLYLMDLHQLAPYKGEITFWGEVDRQRLLTAKDPARVADFVNEVRSTLETKAGGMIAQCKWEQDHPLRNIETVFETWEKDFWSQSD